MKIFNRISKDRYNYPNHYSSVRFIDFMLTDLKNSVEFVVPREVEKVADAIRSVFGYTRYEPTNPYVFHKSVPSARNVHANEAYLVCDGNICRYNCKTNYFECIRYDERERGSFRIVVAAELWRIMKFYGEFGMVLPLLDAGHILAQLKLALEQGGITQADVLYGAKDAEEYQRLNLSPISNLITLEVDFSAYASLSVVEKIEDEYERSMNYDREVSSYEIANELLPFEAGFKVKSLVCSGEKVKPFLHPHKRESAHNSIGICSLEETVSDELAMACVLQTQGCMKRYMEDLDMYNVYVLYQTTQGQMLTAICQGEIQKAKKVEVKMRNLLHDTQRMIDMESMPIAVYVSYIYQNDLSEKENIYNAHIGSAEIIHYFSLCGPKNGLFERPMRNFNDDYVEKVFVGAEHERFMYSLIMGMANTRNFVQHFNG